MKLFSFFICQIVVVLLAFNVNAQSLGSFGSDLGMKSVLGKDIRVPYTDVVSYYGFIKSDAKPDEVVNGKKMYYLYVWIPAAVPELGLRMISPAPEKMKPGKEDIVDQGYKDNSSDTKSYFDTWIQFERSSVVNSANIATGGKAAKWFVLGQNDDNSEMPAQPSGAKYNSLLRSTSNVNDPLKALTIGLYRVAFTTYKKGEVNGSFLAQIGAPVKIPGVKIARSLDELQKLVNNK